MKKNKKRHLSFYAPEINGKRELPLNFSFTQFYSLDIRKDDGTISLFDENLFFMEVEEYNTDHFLICNTLGKPISKIV